MFREHFYIDRNINEKKNNDEELMRILDRRISATTVSQLNALRGNRTQNENNFDPDKRIGF